MLFLKAVFPLILLAAAPPTPIPGRGTEAERQIALRMQMNYMIQNLQAQRQMAQALPNADTMKPSTSGLNIATKTQGPKILTEKSKKSQSDP